MFVAWILENSTAPCIDLLHCYFAILVEQELICQAEVFIKTDKIAVQEVRRPPDACLPCCPCSVHYYLHTLSYVTHTERDQRDKQPVCHAGESLPATCTAPCFTPATIACISLISALWIVETSFTWIYLFVFLSPFNWLHTYIRICKWSSKYELFRVKSLTVRDYLKSAKSAPCLVH